MNLFFIAIFVLLIFIIPRKLKVIYNLLMICSLALLSSIISVDVLSQYITAGKGIYTEVLPFLLWNNEIKIIIDPLSAIFILIINFTMLTSAIYSIEYMSAYKNKSSFELSLFYFFFFLLYFSMILVCMFQNGIVFLVCWELMALSSFMLVIFEHEKSNVIRAGINYLIQMHISALFLIVGFILLNVNTGSYDFNSLKEYFAVMPNIPLFLLFFCGFAIKAGFMPFHTWLPHAHPAAPSNVSAVMSGVMIKLGIYGILRVLLFIQYDFITIGIIILIISLISGIGGVGVAIIQHDIKKLLAYHSIENIGIIGIGIGIGVLGIGLNNQVLAFLGFTGGLLHVLNHSLFKSLLFYSAGSVYLKTHTKNIEFLGGLIKKMPITAFIFLIAALAICGLPPFNGFISEFLIYNGFVNGIQVGGIGLKLGMLFSMMALTLIGGLAIFCFTKAFGTIFLGKSRETNIDDVKEMKWYSLIPQLLIVLAIIFIGLFPGIALKPFAFVSESSFNIIKTNIVNVNNTVTIMEYIGFTGFIFIILIVLIYFIKHILLVKKPIVTSETWGCGYSGSIPKAQYTASSFAENYAFVADTALDIKMKYHNIAPNDIFPKERSFETESEDFVEDKVFKKSLKFFNRFLSRFAVIQTGNTQHYILYAFIMILLLVILTVINVI